MLHKQCDLTDRNLVLAQLQGKEQIERSDERAKVVSQTPIWSEEISSTTRIDCQTTADHDRKGSITTDVDSKKLQVLRGCCCVVIDGDRIEKSFVISRSPVRIRRVAPTNTSKRKGTGALF